MQRAFAETIATMPRRAVTGVAFLLPLVPLLVLVWPVREQWPGIAPAAGNILGFGAVLCLLACLAVTPVFTLAGMKKAARWRRHFGVCVFILGLAGLIIAVSGRDMNSGDMTMRAGGHAKQWTGTLIVILLIPLVLTSSTLAQKMLGGYWKTWQRRLTWAVWGAITIHVVLLGRADVTAAWLLASGPLVITRIPAVRADLSRWRRGSYSDTHLWILAGMAGTAFIAGAAILAGLEVTAIAQLYRNA